VKEDVAPAVAGGFVLTDIPVQGKAQVGHRPEKALALALIGEKGAPKGRRHQIVDMQPPVVDNVGPVIQLPGRSSHMGINGDDQRHEQDQYYQLDFRQRYSRRVFHGNDQSRHNCGRITEF
jgi:hypothetical protein